LAKGKELKEALKKRDVERDGCVPLTILQALTEYQWYFPDTLVGIVGGCAGSRRS
jgi:hypothetical protein